VLRALDHLRQEILRSVRTVVRDDSVEGLEPFARLDRVDVGSGVVDLDSIRHRRFVSVSGSLRSSALSSQTVQCASVTS